MPNPTAGAVISSHDWRSLSARLSTASPAMSAASMAPIEVPVT